jgi:hypothetical protein
MTEDQYKQYMSIMRDIVAKHEVTIITATARSNPNGYRPLRKLGEIDVVVVDYIGQLNK